MAIQEGHIGPPFLWHQVFRTHLVSLKYCTWHGDSLSLKFTLVALSLLKLVK